MCKMFKKKTFTVSECLGPLKTGARSDQHITPSYSMHKTGNKNTETFTFQIKVVTFMTQQILVANLQGNA